MMSGGDARVSQLIFFFKNLIRVILKINLNKFVVIIYMNNMNVNLAPGLSNPLNLENSTMASVDTPNNNMNNMDNSLEVNHVLSTENNVNTNQLNEFKIGGMFILKKWTVRGVVINAGAGDVVVQGEVKSKTSDPTIMFWAPILQHGHRVILEVDYPITTLFKHINRVLM